MVISNNTTNTSNLRCVELYRVRPSGSIRKAEFSKTIESCLDKAHGVYAAFSYAPGLFDHTSDELMLNRTLRSIQALRCDFPRDFSAENQPQAIVGVCHNAQAMLIR